MELIFPAMEHKQAALDFWQEHVDHGEPWIHGSAGLINAESYESWLAAVIAAQTEVPPGLVTSTTYFAIDEGRIVGTISIRHKLNDALMKLGGHIGYGVRPSARRKGYGTAMLTLALAKCRTLGITRALVTCDKDNAASAGTITKNGGVLENEVTQDDGAITRRYWISL